MSIVVRDWLWQRTENFDDAKEKRGILADILNANRQEVIDMLLTEYDEELHIRSEREIALEEGKKRKQEEVIRNLLKRDIPDADICAIAECDQSLVDEVRNQIEHGA